MKRLRIVGIGDSTTAGTPGFLSPLEAPPKGRGNPESQYAYWIMRSYPQWTVLNRGINGQRSDQILSRFGKDVLQEKPDYVIVLAGVNDVYQGRSQESIRKNLRSMYEMALDERIPAVAATILPYDRMSSSEGKAIRQLNLWIKETAQELKIQFCDTNRVVANPTDAERLRGSPDGLHPDISGYRAMGEALAKVIEGHAFPL